MTIKSALRDLNNAIIDIQQADYNTWEDPLRRLADVLQSEDLKQFRDSLTEGLNLDDFMSSADAGGSMMGSARLNWPPEKERRLGFSILIIEKGAADTGWFLNFSHDYYYAASSKIIASIRSLTTSLIIPFGRDFKDYVEHSATVSTLVRSEPADLNRVFIVHGHDDAPKEAVARFVSNVGLEPVILHEQPNKGMTIAEKLIANGNVGFAVVLLTPDDVGRAKAETVDNPRARQNVILELGYFVGRLGRERVCALLKDQVEVPSDYTGVIYTPFDAGGGWRQQLAKELQAVGYNIDWNKVMR